MFSLTSLKKTMYFTKGTNAYKNRQYTQAIGYFVLALKYTSGDIHDIARIKEVIAQTYIAMGRKDRAVNYANASLQIYQKLYDKNKNQSLGDSIKRVTELLSATK